MSYTSIIFLVFLAITCVFYFSLPKKFRWGVLLASSFIFYYLNSGWLAIFLAAATLTIYFSGIAMARINDNFEIKKTGLTKEDRKKLKVMNDKKKKVLVAVALLVNFGMLFLLKYFNFFGDGVNFLFTGLHINAELAKFNWVMPLGISYYTLQSAGYLIDIYRGQIKAERNLGKLALFVCFFPQIVEGPIGRYDKLSETLFEGHSFDYDRFRLGGQLMVWGFFKKLVIADRAALLVNTVFSHYTSYSGLSVAIAVLLFTLQIYADFSGCMDIVTGVALIFGVKLDANFKRPFFSKSVAEFWRRWHITLGAWLRDYIFYSISMSKTYRKFSKNAREKLNGYFAALIPTACALFFVWIGMGIWHGASLKYVLYGFYYYIFMVLGEAFKPFTAKLTGQLKINIESKLFHLYQMLRTFVVVYFGMLIFRSHNIAVAWELFKSIFTGFTLKAVTNGSLLKLGLNGSDYILLLATAVLLLIVGILQENGYKIRELIAQRTFIIRWCIYLIAIFALIIFGIYGKGYNVGTFIYGNF
ncbi:MAG: MBOAT family O-acyltransferase [Eubacteriales bacterium]